MSTAAIFIVGDELLHGETRDKNGPWLLQQLNHRGITVQSLCVLPDQPDRIAGHIRRARSETYVLVTGGIGPTHDDRTREAVAKGVGVPRQVHPRVEEWLEAHYGDRINEARRGMARLPAGSEAIYLEETPALAFRVKNVYVFPGIPVLMQPLFERWDEEFQAAPRVARTHTFRGREGDIAGDLAELQRRYPELQFGSYPHEDGTLSIRIRGENEERLKAAYGEVKNTF